MCISKNIILYIDGAKIKSLISSYGKDKEYPESHIQQCFARILT
jgi:hypothetical protein